MSPNRRSVNIRALCEGREFIKTTAFLLPHKAKMRVIETMEQLRRERMEHGTASAARAPYSPEMTDGEAVREINWRVETLPPGDTDTVVQLIRRLTHWRSARRRKLARTRRPGTMGRSGLPPR